MEFVKDKDFNLDGTNEDYYRDSLAKMREVGSGTDMDLQASGYFEEAPYTMKPLTSLSYSHSNSGEQSKKTP